MGEAFGDLVSTGPFLLAAAIAALAGLISFASPCVLPLVPGYLSFITGLAGGSPRRMSGAAPDGAAVSTAPVQTSRRRLLVGATMFVGGFTLVFILVGAAFGGLGRLLLVHADTITRVMGVVTIVLGLAFLGWLPPLQRTGRLGWRPSAGLAGAPLLGIVFGLGWTPCIGPTLSAVLALSYTEATATRGALLALAYCVGLGVPFLLVALGAGWAVRSTTWLRQHARTVTRTGGVLLILVGILLATGLWTDLMQWFRGWVVATGYGTSFV